MPFSQSNIIEVFPPQFHGREAYLSWSASGPVDTWYQVYLNQQLVWSGQRCWAWVPVPPGPMRVDIGSVGPGEEDANFAQLLPPAPRRRARIAWQSGTYTGMDLAGFHVYGELVQGQGVNFSAPLAEITAYPSNVLTDGFGLGLFGSGGLGHVASDYSWTSGPLSAGPWEFAIVPFDVAGNEGPATTTSVIVAAPPRAPASFPGGPGRLQRSVSAMGQTPFGAGGFGLPGLVLSWNPPPS